MNASKSWTDLLVEYHGDLLDADRVAAATTICQNGGVKLTTITAFLAEAKVGNVYSVMLGRKPGDEDVFTADCNCPDRKHRGTVCKHLIATAIVAENRQPDVTFGNVGIDPAPLMARLAHAYPGLSQSAIVYEALSLLDALVNDPRARKALDDIQGRTSFQSIDELVTASLNYSTQATSLILEASLPPHALPDA